MDEPSNEVLLDEMSTPDGVIELVAYRSSGTVWIGIRPKGWSHLHGSPTESATGLHTGSEERYVEATASIHRTWGVAFGVVAPEVRRVAVRNERREVFPAVIITLPDSLEKEFRAAWGLATNCERECELIGFDGRDRLIAPHTPRTSRRRDLNSPESLDLIRRHCDGGLRYYTWALARMPSLPEQAGHAEQVRNSLQALAVVMAYVEGASDERSAMLDAQEIALRYAETVEDEGWEPPFTQR
jgi:hypothetical protein